MLIRILFLSVFLIPTAFANGSEQFLLDFKITQGERKIEMGKFFVNNKQHVWSKGVKRTYAKVSCLQQSSGKIQKTFSMLDLFSGVRIMHLLEGDKVKLTVTRNTVQPALKEIRALGKNECKNLSPIVTTTTQHYTLPAKAGANEQYAFGKNSTFNANIIVIDSSHK